MTSSQKLFHLSVIAGICLITRLFFGYLFFGSVDVRCFMSMTHCTLNGSLLSFPLWNFFPILPHYLWFVGKASTATTLPFAFCCKLVPIIFDTLIALLIYEAVSIKRPGCELFTGLMYALCPVPIIIVSIHGQWEPLFLFFLLLSFFIRDLVAKSYLHQFLFGLTFGCSILLKPTSLIFLPFFFTPHEHLFRKLQRLCMPLALITTSVFFAIIISFITIKHYGLSLLDIAHAITPTISIIMMLTLSALALLFYILLKAEWPHLSLSLKTYLKRQAISCIGIVSIITLCFFLFHLYGFNLVHLCDTILRYCNQGVQLMGLPFAPGIADSWYAMLIKNRFLLMGVILFLAWKYYHRQLGAFASILITFAVIFGLSGICPQYLMWLIPFMLIRGVYRLCGIYTLCTTIFFVFFYAHPLGNPAMPYQNMLAFASLIPYSAFMPSQAFMNSMWPTLIQFLGSLMIPLVSLVTAVYVYFRTTTHCLIKPIKNNTIPLYLLLTPLGATLIAELCRYGITPWHQEQFEALMTNPLAHYSVTTFSGKVAAHYLEHPFMLNAPTILIAGALLWILASFLYSRKLL